MAEWFKAAVLKTVVRKYRGFESYSLRQNRYGEMTELADGARLLSECGDNTPPRVRIPLSPPQMRNLVELLNQVFLMGRPPTPRSPHLIITGVLIKGASRPGA